MRGCVPYLLVIASILGWTQAATASEAMPNVVVVVSPLTAYVSAITQNAAHVESLLQPGQDPHHFTLAPSQERKLQTADVLVIPDLTMSPALSNLAKANKKLRVIELSKLAGADPLPYATDNPWVAAVKKEDAKKKAKKETPISVTSADGTKKLPTFDAPPVVEEKAETGTVDPHFWLDPERMAAIAPSFATALGDYSPGNRASYAANAVTLAAHLRREVMPEMKVLLSPHGEHHTITTQEEIPFITYHAAYQYFLARFNLAHRGEITSRPEDYMGAKSLDGLLSAAKDVRVRCIIGETNGSLVSRIAALSKARVVLLSPEQNIGQNEAPPLNWLQNDYDRLLYKTAKSFGDCL